MSGLKRLLLYDLDGTLVDTLEDLAEAANHMLRRMGRAAVSPRMVRRAIGRGMRELVKECLGTTDEPRITEGVATFRAYYGAHLLDHSRLYPGTRELLNHFGERPQAVITNKPTACSEELLTGLGIRGYFLDVIGGDGSHPRKPDPSSVLALLQTLDVGPSEAVFIGDSPIDVETGRQAGVMTVGVSHGLVDEAELAAAGPEVLARDFTELLERVRRERW